MAGIPAVVETATVATSGNGATATVQLNRAPLVEVGDSVLISGVTPTLYNGQKTVTARSNTSPYSISFLSTATGSMTVAGNFSVTNAQGGGSFPYSITVATTAAKTDTVSLAQAGQAATATNTKYYATLTLDSAPNVAVGGTITVNSPLAPAGYRTGGSVTGLVTGVSDVYPFSVSYEVLSALGAQTVAGTVQVAGTSFDTGDYGAVGTSNSKLAGRSESSARAFYASQAQVSLIGQRATLFSGLDPNLPFVVALLKALGIALTQAAIDGVTTVVEVLTHITSWIEQAVNAAGEIVGQITTAVVDGAGNMVKDFIDMLHYVLGGGLAKDFGELLSGDRNKTVNELGKKAEEVKTTTYLTNIQSTTTTNFFNTVRVLPAWVGGKNDDVNIPHSFISGTSTTIQTSPSTLGMDGRLVLIPVIAGQDRTWSAVKFGVAQMALGAKVPGYQYFYGTITSASTTTLPVVAPATVGLKQATLGLPRACYVDVGETITVSAFPTSWAGYNGTWTVSAKSDVAPYSVSYVVPALLPTVTPTTQVYTATATATSGTGTTATVTFNSNLGLTVGDSVLVSGVTPTAYNGQKTVTARSNTSPYSVSFASTATGSMTVAGSVGIQPVLTTAIYPSYLPPGVTVPAAVLMGVYDVDETTGDATKVIDLGNIRSKINVGANSQRNLQVISLDSAKIVKMGEIYYIGIIQIGADAGLTPAGAIALSYAPSSVVPYTFNTGTYPKAVCLYHNSATLGVLPSNFLDSQISGSSTSYWGAFGDDTPNVIAPPVTFVDNFTTGTNGVGAGAAIDNQKWLTRYGSGLKVASMPGSELRATADATTGTSMHTYRYKTNYLKQFAQCTFVTGTELIGHFGRGGIILSLRGDGVGQFIYLRLVIEAVGIAWQLRVGIYTTTTYSSVGSEFAGGVLRKEVLLQNFGSPPGGNTWKFVADGYSYIVYRNTGSGFAEYTRWNDTGFAFAGSGPSNSSFKEVGIGAYYVAEYSCIDNWSAWDSAT